MNRTLKRPMFRIGGSAGSGITSGLDKPKKMASAPDAMDELNELAIQIFGKSLRLLTPEEMDILNDEADIIDIEPYLAKALVCYVKARIAEDMRDIEAKEYYMREFRSKVEKHQSALIKTGRFISSGAHAIR